MTRQGLALRGDGDEKDSNFNQLLRLRGEDDSRVFEWLERKTDRYTSPKMQNEIIKVMARKVLNRAQLAHSLHNAPYFTIMVDETTDNSNHEQVVICFQWVSNDFKVHEEFAGLHVVDSIDAITIVQAIHSVLMRMYLPISKARGQCYDGAATMRGTHSRVATRLAQEEPRAVYMHCYGHALNLACGDTLKRCKVMKDALDITHEIIKLIKNSPKRQSCFEKLKVDISPDTPGIRVLCPTRWTVRAEALQGILQNYQVLVELWSELLNDMKDSDARARILGVASQMQKFEYYFGICLGDLILHHSDNLSKTLQKTDISASEGQEVAKMTLKTLSSLRSEENFEFFWERVTKTAKDLDISDPLLPQQRKMPKRYEIGNAQPEFVATPDHYFKCIYFEALDLITTCISERFDQPGFAVYRNVQDLLINATKGNSYQSELEFVLNFYGSDFNDEQLKTQLQVFTANFTDKSARLFISDIIEYFKSLLPAQLDLLSEVCKLLKLCVLTYA